MLKFLSGKFYSNAMKTSPRMTKQRKCVNTLSLRKHSQPLPLTSGRVLEGHEHYTVGDMSHFWSNDESKLEIKQILIFWQGTSS